MSYVQFLKSTKEASVLGVSPYWCSVPQAYKPHRGQWPTQDFPCRCLFPKAYFSSLLAGLPIVSSQTGPYTEGKGRLKKEADHSKLAGKQGSLLTRLVWGGCKMNRSFLYHQNLKSIYRGLNWVQSHMLSKWSQQHLSLPRLCPWKSSHWEW